VGYSDHGLQVFDSSAGEPLGYLGSVPTLGDPRDAVFLNGLAYVADGDAGLTILRPHFHLDSAKLFSYESPAELHFQENAQILMTLLNDGNTTWTQGPGQGGAYALRVTDDPCGLVNWEQSVPVYSAQGIAPGANYAFSMHIRGSSVTGTCSLDFQMSRGGAVFGEKVSGSILQVLDDALFRQDTFPGSLALGQSIGVGITVRNPGTSTWSSLDGYALQVLSDPCSLVDESRIAMRPDVLVPPLDQYQFVFQITAPAFEIRSCSLELQMIRGVPLSGVSFGATVTKTLLTSYPINISQGWELFD